jgi:hypothetical protein
VVIELNEGGTVAPCRNRLDKVSKLIAIYHLNHLGETPRYAKEDGALIDECCEHRLPLIAAGVRAVQNAQDFFGPTRTGLAG